jgi:hypothetical protein
VQRQGFGINRTSCSTENMLAPPYNRPDHEGELETRLFEFEKRRKGQRLESDERAPRQARRVVLEIRFEFV